MQRFVPVYPASVLAGPVLVRTYIHTYIHTRPRARTRLLATHHRPSVLYILLYAARFRLPPVPFRNITLRASSWFSRVSKHAVIKGLHWRHRLCLRVSLCLTRPPRAEWAVITIVHPSPCSNTFNNPFNLTDFRLLPPLNFSGQMPRLSSPYRYC